MFRTRSSGTVRTPGTFFPKRRSCGGTCRREREVERLPKRSSSPVSAADGPQMSISGLPEMRSKKLTLSTSRTWRVTNIMSIASLAEGDAIKLKMLSRGRGRWSNAHDACTVSVQLGHTSRTSRASISLFKERRRLVNVLCEEQLFHLFA